MKNKPFIALFIAALIAVAVLTYWYAKRHFTCAETSVAVSTLPAISPLIVTAQPVMRRFSLRVPLTGIVEPRASVVLVTQAAGRITAVEADDQTWIEKGKPVARLGGPRIETRRARLAAEIEALSAQLDLARQTVEGLKQNLQARLVTNNQVATAQGTQFKLQRQLREARLGMEVLERQGYIFASMSGVFTKRRVSVGQDVGAGQVVGEIIGTSHLRIVASLFPPPGFDLQGKEATVRLGQDQAVSGIIRRLLPEANSTGAVMVWIEGPQIDKQLRPGQTVSGVVVAGLRADRLAVPESAIVYDPKEHPYLFVEKDGIYEPHRVRLGLRQKSWVETLSGLEKGQLVVTSGAYELFYREFASQFKVQD